MRWWLHLHEHFASDELPVGLAAAWLIQLEEEGSEEEGGEGGARGVDGTEGQLGTHSVLAPVGMQCPPQMPKAAPSAPYPALGGLQVQLVSDAGQGVHGSAQDWGTGGRG